MYAPSEEEMVEIAKWSEYARISALMETRDHYRILITYANGDRSLASQETYDTIVGIDEIGDREEDLPTLQRRLTLMEEDITLSIDRRAIKDQIPLLNEEIFKTLLDARRNEIKREQEIREQEHREFMDRDEIKEQDAGKSNSVSMVMVMVAIAILALVLFRT